MPVRRLAVEAAELVAATTGLAQARARALHALARRLAGERMGWAEEVEATYGVRPEPGRTEDYEAAHAALGDLLPGRGALAPRLAAWRAAALCPPGLVGAAVAALAGALGVRTRERWPLPAGERVDWDVVGRAPWAGAARRTGPLTTRVAVSAGLPVRLDRLPALVAHEAYPGHHTAGCRRSPEVASVVLTPDALVAEGAAVHALAAVCPEGWGGLAQAAYAGLGLSFDGALAERVVAVLAPLGAVRQDAALLLHGPGSSHAGAVQHLARWGLMSPRRVEQTLAFVADPLWRSYIATYVEGGRVVGAWLARQEDRVAAYARLLDAPLTAADLA